MVDIYLLEDKRQKEYYGKFLLMEKKKKKSIEGNE